MKKLLFGLLVCISLASVAVLSWAGHRGSEHTDCMIDKLELTEEQAAQFRDVMQENRKELLAFRETQREETLSQLETFMSAEQLQKFQEMREHKANHHKKH